MKYFRKPALFVIIAAVLSSCSSMQQYQSVWTSNEIKIDGNDEEWQGFSKYFPDEKIILSIRNDSSNLYVFIRTNDPGAIRKIMGAGMTLWLNGKGNKSEPFGIHYPVGMANRSGYSLSREDNPGGNDDEAFRKDMEARRQKMLSGVELLRDDGRDVNYTKTDEINLKYHINLAVNTSDESLTYEASIPLNSGSDLLKSIKPENNEMGIGIETGEMKKPDFGNRGGMSGGVGGYPGGGMPGGSYPPGGGGYPMGGGRGGRHGGGGGRTMGGGMSEDAFKRIQLWLDLTLANNNDAKHISGK